VRLCIVTMESAVATPLLQLSRQKFLRTRAGRQEMSILRDFRFDALAEVEYCGLEQGDPCEQNACVRGSTGVCWPESSFDDVVGDFFVRA
jgi:hypothetical protein